MKKLLILLFIPIVCFGQFEMLGKVKSTNYFSVESIKNHWKDSNQDFYDLEGIYEPFGSNDASVLGYVLGIIKVNDYYEIIMLGRSLGDLDVNKGAVIATAKKMPAQYLYNLRWRVANPKKWESGSLMEFHKANTGIVGMYASNVEKGFMVFENTVLNATLTVSGMTIKFIKTFDPNSLTSNTNKSIGWSGNGSGIIVSKSGHIVTNNHVIEGAKNIEIELISNGETKNFNAEVVQKDLRNDLAILKIIDVNFDGLNNINYNFKTRSSDVGTKIYTFGYPKALSGMGKEIKVTEGIISSKSGIMGDITTYQITAPIQGGNSGGPLFDDKGNLVGINSSRFKSDETENVNYSIKSSYVLNLIDVLPKSIDLPSSTKLQSLPLTEQIKEISKYVVLVKVK